MCWKFREQFYLLLHEKIALALVAWLIFASIIRPNALGGIEFVVSEYRTLWMAPFIGFAVSMVLNKEELVFPLILGSLLNLGGSFLLVLQKIGFVVSRDLGLSGSHHSLGGKFVQGLILTFWSGVWFASALVSKRKRLFFGVATLLWLFAFYHSYELVSTRSGIFTSILCILAIGFVVVVFKHKKIGFGVGVIMVGVLSMGTMINSGPPYMQALKPDVKNFLDKKSTGSVAIRLQSLGSILELELAELAVGAGGGNWYKKMLELREENELNAHIVSWRDFHSEIVWLMMLGGSIAVILYCYLAFAIAREASNFLISGNWFVGGVGIAITLILLGFGLLNSIFTNVREAHVIALGLIIWSVLLRYARAGETRKKFG